MTAEAASELCSGQRAPAAPARAEPAALTYAEMRELLTAAILGNGARPCGMKVVKVIADLARVAMRLELKAISLARLGHPAAFEATLAGAYAAPRARLCEAVAAVYDGRMSLADAKMLLREVRANTTAKSPIFSDHPASSHKMAGKGG